MFRSLSVKRIQFWLPSCQLLFFQLNQFNQFNHQCFALWLFCLTNVAFGQIHHALPLSSIENISEVVVKNGSHWSSHTLHSRQTQEKRQEVEEETKKAYNFLREKSNVLFSVRTDHSSWSAKKSLQLIPLDQNFRMHLLGIALDRYEVGLTDQPKQMGNQCESLYAPEVPFKLKLIESIAPRNKFIPSMYEYEGKLSSENWRNRVYFFCVSIGNLSVHQGSGEFVEVELNKEAKKTYSVLMISLASIVGLFLSGLFSGLTLGIMTLDPNELKVLIRFSVTFFPFVFNLI